MPVVRQKPKEKEQVSMAPQEPDRTPDRVMALRGKVAVVSRVCRQAKRPVPMP
jgi:hypothetical protein